MKRAIRREGCAGGDRSGENSLSHHQSGDGYPKRRPRRMDVNVGHLATPGSGLGGAQILLKRDRKRYTVECRRLPGMALLASIGDPAENQSVVLPGVEWCGHDGFRVVACARSDNIDVAGNEGVPVVVAIDSLAAWRLCVF